MPTNEEEQVVSRGMTNWPPAARGTGKYLFQSKVWPVASACQPHRRCSSLFIVVPIYNVQTGESKKV